MIDMLPEPAVVFSGEGGVRHVNAAFSKAFGWNLQALQESKEPFLLSGHKDLVAHIAQELAGNRRINKVRAQLAAQDGCLREVSLSASLAMDPQGRPMGNVVIVNDISEEVKTKRRFKTMLEISSKLAAYPDLEPLLGYIGLAIKENLGAESASIMVLDPELNEIFFRLIQAPRQEVCRRIKKARFPASLGLAGHVLQTGQPLIVMDVQSDPRFFNKVDEGSGFVTRSLAYAPLVLNQNHIGVLGAVNKFEGDFCQDDLDFLTMLAHTVALAIENARVREVEKLAMTDPLTGLPNRRYLLDKLREELQRSCRYGLFFSVIYADLDGFKQVNDRFGHPEGDKVLKMAGEAIRETARLTDTVARYGGDEFVLLLPETRGEEAAQLASRISLSLSQDRFPPQCRFLTASFGISTFNPGSPVADEESLLRLADQALMEAKRSGRNKVIQLNSHLSEDPAAP